MLFQPYTFPAAKSPACTAHCPCIAISRVNWAAGDNRQAHRRRTAAQFGACMPSGPWMQPHRQYGTGRASLALCATNAEGTLVKIHHVFPVDGTVSGHVLVDVICRFAFDALVALEVLGTVD